MSELLRSGAIGKETKFRGFQHEDKDVFIRPRSYLLLNLEKIGHVFKHQKEGRIYPGWLGLQVVTQPEYSWLNDNLESMPIGKLSDSSRKAPSEKSKGVEDYFSIRAER